MHFCTDGIDIGPLSALLRQPGGVQVGDGARLDLEGLSLDVVAGDLLRGLADGDGLAALAADVNGLAVLLPAHRPHRGVPGGRRGHRLQLLDGSLRHVKGLRGAMVGLQVLHGLLAQGDDVHLLGLVRHLALQHTQSLDPRALVQQASLSGQSHVLVCRLGEEGQPGVGRVDRVPLRGYDADLLVLTRHKVNVAHVSRDDQLDLLLGGGGQLVLLQLQDAALVLRGGSLLAVRLGVCPQVVQAREGEAAARAGEGLLPRVRGDVPPPRAGVREGFVADVTVVGLLASEKGDQTFISIRFMTYLKD